MALSQRDSSSEALDLERAALSPSRDRLVRLLRADLPGSARSARSSDFERTRNHFLPFSGPEKLFSRARHPLLHSPSLPVGISGPLNYSLLGDQVVRASARFDVTRRRHKPTQATTQPGDAECVATSRQRDGRAGHKNNPTPQVCTRRKGSSSPRSRSWALPEVELADRQGASLRCRGSVAREVANHNKRCTQPRRLAT